MLLQNLLTQGDMLSDSTRLMPLELAEQTDGRTCDFCFATATPMWRRGPGGTGTLCNGNYVCLVAELLQKHSGNFQLTTLFQLVVFVGASKEASQSHRIIFLRRPAPPPLSPSIALLIEYPRRL